MNIVSLEGMDFFAYHGFYEEERKIGNRYTVDVSVETDFSRAAAYDELDYTVNYEIVYSIVKEEMAVSSRLLEHVGERIINRLHNAFPVIASCQVEIIKHNPPLGGLCSRARITLKRFFAGA
jgi:dihydroneopterin aldolase